MTPTSRDLSRHRLRPYALGIAISAVLVLVFTGIALFEPFKTVRYPQMVISVVEKGTDSLTSTFVFAPQSTEELCNAQIDAAASVMLASCPTCKVTLRQCSRSLQADRIEFLSDRPLPFYSVRLPAAVVIFEASKLEIAQSACNQSEQQSGAAKLVRCYPPGTQRPYGTVTSTSALWWTRLSDAMLWEALALIALGALILQTAVAFGPSVGARAILLSRKKKQVLVMAADTMSLLAALAIAHVVRSQLLNATTPVPISLMLIAPIVGIPVFAYMGLYRTIVRYMDLHALGMVVKATIAYTALLLLLDQLALDTGAPRTEILLQGAITALLVLASRALAWHWLTNLPSRQSAGTSRRNVIIYGAGAAGVQLAAGLAHSQELAPVAMIDDNPSLHNKRIGSLDVYAPAELGDLVKRHYVAEVLLAMPSVTRTRRRDIIANLEPLPVHVRTLPGMADLAGGKVEVSDLREVGIDDLLGRDPVEPDRDLMATNITGKAVMVTGAGGSIGSELCRQILRCHPSDLVLFEQNEYALYAIEQELERGVPGAAGTPARLWSILGSVCDEAHIARVMSRFGIDTVYHAAAYKHVPMVEKNPCQAVANNIFGTWRTARAALKTGVETFVLISTDKAVRPTNTMGTTKRFAEMILQSLAKMNPGMRLTMVRFGNVLGSSGSVVPLFREQIRRGGPITVTDPNIVRYFMTIPEAAQLVIQAGAMGTGGDVFVLDMGEPVRILDLAHRMIHLSGLTVKDENNDGDIEIVFSGLRPGEKLHEELLIGNNVAQTSHQRIFRADEKTLPLERIENLLAGLSDACAENDSDGVRQLLLEAVEEFSPQCENQDLLVSR